MKWGSVPPVPLKRGRFENNHLNRSLQENSGQFALEFRPELPKFTTMDQKNSSDLDCFVR
jgi:hypothetical protein